MLHEPQAVLAAALEAYVAVDTDGRVVGWNPAAEALFGYTHAQACGEPVVDLVFPERHRDAHRAGLAQLAAGEPSKVLGQRLRMPVQDAEGHEFQVEMTVAATNGPTGRIFHAFCHDITASYRAGRFTTVESAVARGLAEAKSSDTAVERVVEVLGTAMGWPMAEVWLADEPRQSLHCASRHTAPGRELGDFEIPAVEPGTGLPGHVYAEEAARWIPDLAEDTTLPRDGRAAASAGLHVAVGVPVCVGKHAIGALCVYGDRAEDPEDALTAFLAGIAAQIGQYWERRRAEELAIELARTKDEFVALVTHELRNPLSIIASTAAMFDEEIGTLTPEDQRRYLDIISRNTNRLTVMADDLLELGRLESGNLAFRPVDTELSAIIGAAVDTLRPRADEKRLTLVVELPAGRLPMRADPDRLRQVADNLLTNSIKYTPAGGTVTVCATADGDGWIRWTVSDTGIGIPQTERANLFRRFFRASTAIDMRIPGVGLGLVITRTIIERHHGSITLGDHNGPGTTFVIRMPASPPTAEAT
ncbi:ATP-binding protein [Actinoplanes sp. NPDC049118]|uniref:sensor histidine kinase n=1 Tax=Actinoplanes sp. NPDC049118 TaxID=3155769 RepID=UPI0033EB6C52